MMNLFESFDPANTMNFSLNWLNLMLLILIFPNSFWMIPNRMKMFFLIFMNFIFYEFKLMMLNKFKINLILFFNLLIMILMLNFFSLFPYIFTSTSHMSFNLSMSIPLWISFMIFSFKNKPKKTFSHFVPLNTPYMLMNFMVIIEFISNFIRPWTLAIRLTANMIAGHLLLILLGTFMTNYLYLFFFSFFIQNLLFILEISVSIIQSYVFSILMLLYFIEISD